MRCLLTVLICFGWAGLAFAQTTIPSTQYPEAAPYIPKTATPPTPAANAEQYLEDREQLTRKLHELEALREEIVRLRVATKTPDAEQVMLQVQVLEVSLTKLKALGLEEASKPAANTEVFTSGVLTPESDLAKKLETWRKHPVIKVLAKPRLVTQSGKPGYFNAGGEIPVQVTKDLVGGEKVDYRPYGTQVDFLPTVRADGILHIQVRSRISELDERHSIQVGKVNVPGINTREIDTTFDVQSGQTMAIRAVPQAQVVKSGCQASKEEIELIFLFTATRITPELVARSPVAPKTAWIMPAPVLGLPR